MKVLVINGPNLNLLGSREPGIYGANSYEALVNHIGDYARDHGFCVDVVQSNCEGEIVDAIQNCRDTYDGVVINPGAYTHYSYAIYDALRATDVPAVEVHLSNISDREAFRKISVTAPACVGQISGLGFYSYSAALGYFRDKGGLNL
ncbi:MAG: type II 3-dehydroquinate dehydratase [Peptococcaceae bacterium]|nr:type II 3-dehydroquinate dehydratase [Peptococcaceae bacterium]